MRVKILIFAIIFQILSLIAMLTYAYAPIYFGKEIKVDVTLYDPRDLLRGNYVSLNYDFSALPIKYADLQKPGTKIYLALKDINGTYVKDEYSFVKPKNQIFLTGRIYGNRAKFGIEAFFMPIDKALQIERDIRQKGAWAILSVMDNGSARIKEIVLKE
ncbi:GDYXXLXY domain-containing protein [Campylobacter sp. RM16192]|uniref:GDYXXLXY domain-containing protein n=1 Tax=Campylobacter sp. RM16192 TaxID=1660080 RepID=UPI0014523831|nr:GDYXXLXY domain-containing protein [Campylobacter sp. RM16192]QCD52617.1 putative protein (GDYXXLXY domain) [Campylobacter sp. RM16192]